MNLILPDLTKIFDPFCPLQPLVEIIGGYFSNGIAWCTVSIILFNGALAIVIKWGDNIMSLKSMSPWAHPKTKTVYGNNIRGNVLKLVYFLPTNAITTSKFYE